MPRYHWQSNTGVAHAVTHVDVQENLSYRFAYLHLRDDLTPEQMAAVPDQLQRHGLVAFKDVRDGEPVVRVRGFKKATELFQTLQQEGLVEGQFTSKEALQEELDPKARDFKKFIKRNSIPLAGVTYLFADAMPILSGLKQHNAAEVSQGLMWATTSLALALFGRKSANVQQGNMYTGMKEYLYKEGISLEEDDRLALQQLQRDPSYWNKFINWMYENPVLFNNTLQGIGGVKMAQAGWERGDLAHISKRNPFKATAGASVAFGQWAGMIIPEDQYAGLTEEEKSENTKAYLRGEGWPQGVQTKLTDNPVAWVQEKPLRLTGIFPSINNVLAGWGAVVYERGKIHEWFGIEKKWSLKDAFIPTGDKEKHTGRTLESVAKETGKGGRYQDYLGLKKRFGSLDTKGYLSKLQEKMAVTGEDIAALTDYVDLEQELQYQKKRNIARQFVAASPGFNLAANYLYGISSKEDRSDINSEKGYIDEITSLGAAIYAKVPEEQRARKMSKFAGFIAQQPDVAENQSQLFEMLAMKVSDILVAWEGKDGAQDSWADKMMAQKQVDAQNQAMMV